MTHTHSLILHTQSRAGQLWNIFLNLTHFIDTLMTLEQIADIISADTNQPITECEIVQKIIALTKVDFIRAVAGYIMMREKGLINKFVLRHTIGTIDAVMENDKIKSIIEAFDAMSVNVTVKRPIMTKPNPSDYLPDEIIPGTKMTRNELSAWLCEDGRKDPVIEYTKNKQP